MASSAKHASASASTPTSIEDGIKCDLYEVFINHRGPDVKKTFASHLYHRLRAHRLQVFLDQEELQKGDNLTPQIESAIRAASVHIAILSPNYCESPWCLDELLLMLKSKQESGSTIIPIFYNVKPSELRRTQVDNSLSMCNPSRGTEGNIGVYARALRVLEEKKTFDTEIRQQKLRYDSDTIRKWRDALYVVAGISGFELEAYNGGDEGRLLIDVVERVLEIVPKAPLDVSKYPTGLEDKVKDFENGVLLQEHENVKGRVVGIVGFGGIGKTTLAKHFFNRKRSHYSRSCFLFDVRGSSLKSLQNTLLGCLNPFSKEIDNTAEGIGELRKHLSSSRALIILDDVDNIEQLNALLPVWDALDSKNLIIVTSRHKDVLTSWGIERSSIYRLQGLDQQYSRTLFCWHAFHQPYPDAIFSEVVDKFVKACDGLPLSLKVIGALLYGEKDLENWEAQFLRFSKILPMDIRNTLKNCYDSLEEDEKQIFLDVACFFIGEDKDTAIRIWNGCGWSGRLALQKLDAKCLVELHRKKCTIIDPVLEVDGKQCIKMHDHLRDLGRSVAETEPRRRIWGPDFHWWSFLAVRGITNFAQCSPRIHYIGQHQLSSLKLLRAEGCLDNVFRSYNVHKLTPELIWLCWSNCPHDSIPSSIPMKELRVLCIKGSKFKTLWQHQSQVPLHLRELHIATDSVLKIPTSIGQLNQLEKIVLEPDKILGRLRLETLPPEFGHLKSLKHLELRSCSKLKSLPDCLCRLGKLQHINLYECRDLQELPGDFGQLTDLRHFRLTRSQLQTFPESFGNLRKLEHIDLKFTKFQIIPESFGKLTSLQHIDLSYCRHLEMVPSCFDNLTNLQYVDLSHCSRLERIPLSFGKIRNLHLDNCSRLKKLPFKIDSPIAESNNNDDNLTSTSQLSTVISIASPILSNEINGDNLTSLFSMRESMETRNVEVKLSSLTSLLSMGESVETRDVEVKLSSVVSTVSADPAILSDEVKARVSTVSTDSPILSNDEVKARVSTVSTDSPILSNDNFSAVPLVSGHNVSGHNMESDNETGNSTVWSGFSVPAGFNNDGLTSSTPGFRSVPRHLFP